MDGIRRPARFVERTEVSRQRTEFCSAGRQATEKEKELSMMTDKEQPDPGRRGES